MGRRSYVPKVVTTVVRVWQPHPVAVAYARAIARVWGPGISGGRGTILTPKADYAGYVSPPQLFTGWNPADQLNVGTPLTSPSGLPGTSLPLGSGSPLDSAMSQIMSGSN